MSMRATLSGALQLVDVNDFMTPSTACVLPQAGGARPAPREPPGSVLAPIVPVPARESPRPNAETLAADAAAPAPAAATVTLSDCLACSGCATTAEPVLLSEASVDAARAFLLGSAKPLASPPSGAPAGARQQRRPAVVALSQQAVASVAAARSLTLQGAARRLSTFFRETLGVDAVVDLAFARHVALAEAAAEFISRYRRRQRPQTLTPAQKKKTEDEATDPVAHTATTTGGNPTSGRRARRCTEPVIAAACPGWVVYAEKTQPQRVLDTLSAVRSPQAIAGSIAQLLVGSYRQNVSASDDAHFGATTTPVWLLAVMPCHEKKLEAARPQFRTLSAETEFPFVDGQTPGKADPTPEVDCVLTAAEVLRLADELHVDIASLRETELDQTFDAGPHGFGSAVATGSGGYAEYILRVAAAELLGVTLPAGRIDMPSISKSGDLRAITVRSLDGEKSLTFATAYGFRSLQSVLRKVRHGLCEFDYIELMACPGGCNNGGGQVTGSAQEDKHSKMDRLSNVEAIYHSALNSPDPTAVPMVSRLYEEIIKAPPGSAEARRLLHTTYERREQTSMSSLNW
jgi:iron only hydrogenase large subunit-like protein